MEFYWVQIRREDETDWHVIHPIDWETTDVMLIAEGYADEVLRDHPQTEVRVIGESNGCAFVDRYLVNL